MATTNRQRQRGEQKQSQSAGQKQQQKRGGNPSYSGLFEDSISLGDEAEKLTDEELADQMAEEMSPAEDDCDKEDDYIPADVDHEDETDPFYTTAKQGPVCRWLWNGENLIWLLADRLYTVMLMENLRCKLENDIHELAKAENDLYSETARKKYAQLYGSMKISPSGLEGFYLTENLLKTLKAVDDANAGKGKNKQLSKQTFLGRLSSFTVKEGNSFTVVGRVCCAQGRQLPQIFIRWFRMLCIEDEEVRDELMARKSTKEEDRLWQKYIELRGVVAGLQQNSYGDTSIEAIDIDSFRNKKKELRAFIKLEEQK